MSVINPFTGPGSTPSRRRFWDHVAQVIESKRKIAGRFVTVDEHEGSGSVINVIDTGGRGGGGGGPGAIGACCVGADCYEITSLACQQIGGIFHEGTTCDPNPCSGTTGACCIDGVCSILTAAACASGGGDYQGDGIPCSPNPCPSPENPSGCCFYPDDPECHEVTQDVCFFHGSTPTGPDFHCCNAPNNSCCFSTEEFPSDCCTDPDGGYFCCQVESGVEKSCCGFGCCSTFTETCCDSGAGFFYCCDTDTQECCGVDGCCPIGFCVDGSCTA